LTIHSGVATNDRYSSSNNEGMPINRYDDTLHLYQPNICQSFYITLHQAKVELHNDRAVKVILY